MTDGVSPSQDVKFMSDAQLKQELAAPTGLVPGYMVMSELQDRAGLRSGSGAAQQPSMKDQMLAQPDMSPSRQYSRGGMIGALNPFDTAAKVMDNPKLAQGYAQDAINAQSGGLPSLSPAQPVGAPGAPPGLDTLLPTAPNVAQQPRAYAHGGLATLMRR